jgi:FMN phosphatase YigB (HAD superfamily)
MSQAPFDHLVFDLDDTLLDTFGQLIPRASKEACVAMIEAGLATDLETCLLARDQIAKTNGRADLYRNLVQRFGVREGASADAVAAAGHRAFHDRTVERDISLFAGTRDMLHDLRPRYRLYLVTAGSPGTQQEKIDILKLEDSFDEIHIVNIMRGETKGKTFASIQNTHGGQPSRYLSVGNRLDTDIAPAKRLGWKTCWVTYGEYAYTSPSDEFEMPDFEISTMEELLSTCRL